MQYIYKEQNIDKVNWKELSSNKNAIHLLEQNIDNIDWTEFSNNPSIFTYDYDKLKENMMYGFYDELISKILHPDRLMRISQKYNIEFIILVQIYYD